MAEHAYGDGPFVIVSSSISSSLLTWEHRVVLDGGIGSVVVPTALLYALQMPNGVEVPYARP